MAVAAAINTLIPDTGSMRVEKWGGDCLLGKTDLVVIQYD